MLEISFLGEQRLAVDGTNVTAAIPQRTQGLIAALVLHPGQDQLRSSIASAFWPDSTDEQSLTNLRRELHALRQRVPEFCSTLHTGGSLIRWEQSRDVRCDVAEFVTAAEGVAELFTAEAPSVETVRTVEKAVAQYSGELLPAWVDEWVLEPRERLHRTCVELLDRLLALPDALVELDRRVAYAARRVELEPFEEAGYRSLMSLQAAAGDRAAALTTFHRCASMLERELGVSPDPATVQLYESLVSATPSPSGQPSRTLTSAGRVPLIGRERELKTLENKWAQTQLGDGGLHLIVGEPGVGKTRLLSEFAAEVGRSGGLVARARCYSSRARLSMAPIAEWLSTPSLQVQRARLDPTWITEVERLAPASGAAPSGQQAMIDAWQRHRFFEGLAHAVLVSERPTLLTLDDIQWCDGETLAWLQFFLRRADDHAVLIVSSGREEEFEDNAELIALISSLRVENRLTKSELTGLAPDLVSELARRAGSTAPDDESLFEVTQGLPLYVIESARAEVGRNESLTAVLEGSPRVQAVLDGRLDQLGQEASSIAGLAAVIGQEFTPDLLERASDLPADRVVDGLDELWRRRIIVHHRRGTYGFSHELLRDASLRRVPPPRLASLHRRVAEALQDTGVDAGTRAGRIADHYEQAGLSERALPFHEQAASLAVERFAHDAAIDHFHAACRLLGSLPPGEERDRHELRLRHLVSAPLNARYGFASRELQDEVERGLELAERLHDRRLEVVSLVGLFSSFVVQGRVVEAYEVARRALAASDGQPEVLGQVHFAVGGSAMMLGRLDEGIEQFDLVPQLAMDRPAAVVGTRPEVHSAAWQGHTLWLVGRGEEARERLQWARERAEELDHVFSLAVALAYAAMHAQFEEDQERVVELAGLTSELCAKHGFRYYGDWAHILAGWASGGRIGLATIQDGLAGLNSQRAYIRRSYYLTLRADLELSEGMEDAARRTLRQAHELAIEKSDLWWLPEVLRRRALLEPEQVAKDLLQEACAVAEAQGSVTLARRAQADLAAFGQR